MNQENPFEHIPVAGQMTISELSEYLTEIGDRSIIDNPKINTYSDSKQKDYRLNLWSKRAWMHTAHTFGYLAPASSNHEPVSISHAGNIAPDTKLKNARIKITLDVLRVADYPGSGKHFVLFDFYAQNQLADAAEHLHFNNVYEVQEGEKAGMIGYPIFIGLNVGSEGVAFRCLTINVKNESDEKFLSFLDSDVFKAGLELGTKLQPAIGPLSKMAIGISESIAKRNRNKGVQNFYMGLDFSNIATRARLREGSYIAVQIPETLSTVWDWDEWVFDPSHGQIVNKNNAKQLIPYNYIVFSISIYKSK